MYLIGGKKESGIRVSQYDLKNKSWKSMPKLNHARSSCLAIVLQSRIFVVGGQDAASNLVGSLECLDIHAGSAWSLLVEDNQLFKRTNAAVVAVSDTKFVVFGGLQNLVLLNTGFEFDTQSDSDPVREILSREQDFAFSCYT